MDGSDDELGLEDIEVVQNPYYHHAPEFEDFEVIEGIMPKIFVNSNTYSGNK